MSNTEKVLNFIDRIREHASNANGKSQVDFEFVRRIVADDPETAAAAVMARCWLAERNHQPALLQLALITAAAYEAEFKDDSLVLFVKEAEARVPGGTMPPIEIQESEQQPTIQKPLEMLAVPPEDLKSCNISDLVRLFSIDWADSKRLSELGSFWGKCIITFGVEDDPREVTSIPQVRQFIQHLDKALPYFPCYLDFEPEFGMFLVYFGCLADPAALIENATGGPRLNALHESVLSRVGNSLLAIQQMAHRLKVDPVPAWLAILSVYPPDVASTILQRLK